MKFKIDRRDENISHNKLATMLQKQLLQTVRMDAAQQAMPQQPIQQPMTETFDFNFNGIPKTDMSQISNITKTLQNNVMANNVNELSSNLNNVENEYNNLENNGQYDRIKRNIELVDNLGDTTRNNDVKNILHEHTKKMKGKYLYLNKDSQIYKIMEQMKAISETAKSDFDKNEIANMFSDLTIEIKYYLKYEKNYTDLREALSLFVEELKGRYENNVQKKIVIDNLNKLLENVKYIYSSKGKDYVEIRNQINDISGEKQEQEQQQQAQAPPTNITKQENNNNDHKSMPNAEEEIIKSRLEEQGVIADTPPTRQEQKPEPAQAPPTKYEYNSDNYHSMPESDEVNDNHALEKIIVIVRNLMGLFEVHNIETLVDELIEQKKLIEDTPIDNIESLFKSIYSQANPLRVRQFVDYYRSIHSMLLFKDSKIVKRGNLETVDEVIKSKLWGKNDNKPETAAETAADNQPETAADNQPETAADNQPETAADAQPEAVAEKQADITIGDEYIAIAASQNKATKQAYNKETLKIIVRKNKEKLQNYFSKKLADEVQLTNELQTTLEYADIYIKFEFTGIKGYDNMTIDRLKKNYFKEGKSRCSFIVDVIKRTNIYFLPYVPPPLLRDKREELKQFLNDIYNNNTIDKNIYYTEGLVDYIMTIYDTKYDIKT